VAKGTLAWKFEFRGYVHATPAVVDGVAYIAGCDETFRGIRVADGREVVNIPVGAYMGASPAFDGTAAYVGTFENTVLGIDMKARKVTWSYRHPERVFPYYSSAAVAEGLVVLGGRDKMVHALDAKSGKERWTFMTNARVESSPAIVGNRVFVGSSDGRLYVLDLLKGGKLWEFEAGDSISASPAIAGGRLVIGTQDGRLYCFG
jgi:outer membrane protein assembly factor BamB